MEVIWLFFQNRLTRLDFSVMCPLVYREAMKISAKCLLSFCLALWATTSLADITNNKIVITRLNKKCLNVDFSLSPVFTIHQILTPQMAWDNFFTHYTSMNEVAFKKEITKLSSALKTSSRITDLEGKPFIFANWKWPEAQPWIKTLKEEQILFLTGANSQGHAKPIEVHAQACSNQTINTIQFTFDPRLYPIDIVSTDNNPIVLTKEAPFATAEFY